MIDRAAKTPEMPILEAAQRSHAVSAGRVVFNLHGNFSRIQPWHKLKVSGKVDDVLCLGFPRQSTLQSSVISKFFSNLWPLPRRTDMLTLLYGGSRDFLILAIFNLHCLWLPANQSDYRPRIQTWQWWQLVGLEDTEIGSYQQQVLHFMAIWHTEKWPQSCLFH